MQNLRIAVPVAQFHPGNTSEYVVRALQELGHSASIMNCEGFYEGLRSDGFDLFICIDSGMALDFAAAATHRSDLSRVAFWCIDFRHNKARPERSPNDLENVRELCAHGGIVFQAQQEDAAECIALGLNGVQWLPLAADPVLWSDQPALRERRFDIGFVGNVWDEGRLRILQKLQGEFGARFGFGGGGRYFKEQAAAFLRQCRAGFNVNSFFGSDIAFDVNMRVYETLSCGLPLITNAVPGLSQFGPVPFVRTYNGTEELLDVVHAALRDEQFLSSGPAARSWIEQHATYRHRVQTVLAAMML